MITAGRIAFSKAGRDKGLPFAVVNADDTFAYLVNGKMRPLKNPKKKKLIHLQLTSSYLPNESLKTDKEIRKALALYADTRQPA